MKLLLTFTHNWCICNDVSTQTTVGALRQEETLVLIKIMTNGHPQLFFSFTFESFLVEDDRVVFWRFSQAKELAPETRGEGKI